MVKYAEDTARQQLPVVMSRNFIFGICICILFVLFRLLVTVVSVYWISFVLVRFSFDSRSGFVCCLLESRSTEDSS